MRSARGTRRRLGLVLVGALCVVVAAGGSVTSGQSRGAQALDPALIARGDSVFRGRLGGSLCWTCHGANAKGQPNMGPDLTDTVWLHVDGTVAQIEALVRTGVARPKRGTVPMPPWGGPPLDSARLHAVSVYVASLSRR
jgi:mono/diheme cytochrome c family protein